MQLFQTIVEHIGSKIHPKLFELILQIGINFASKENDDFWFALVDCTDYGMTFDSTHLIGPILDQALLKNGDSWKAMCLLCILIQDYTSVKQVVTNCVMKKSTQVVGMFSPVTDYTVCCYLFELLSQLGTASIVKALFPSNSFPLGGYANDTRCNQFLQQFELDPSIFTFEAVEIDSARVCGESRCQLTQDWLIVIVDQNEFAAPIQIDHSNIKNVQRGASTVQFTVETSVKKALVNFDITALSSFKFEFGEIEGSERFFHMLKNISGISTTFTSTPRKISVVQNFIDATTRTLEEPGELSDAETVVEVEERSPSAMKLDHQQSQQSKNQSSDIQETDSIFGSPDVNNTKDTTNVSAKRVVGYRAISTIVAKQKGNPNPGTLFQVSPSLQIPESMENMLDGIELDKPPIPKIAQKMVKKSTAKAKEALTLKDIWDFDDDSLSDVHTIRADKCRVMKLIDDGKKPPTAKLAKKSAVQTKLEQAHEVDEGKTLRDFVIPDSQGLDASFSGTTSPIVSLHKRAASKAISKINKQLNLLNSYNSESKKRVTEESDDSYEPSLESPVKKQKTIAEPEHPVVAQAPHLSVMKKKKSGVRAGSKLNSATQKRKAFNGTLVNTSKRITRSHKANHNPMPVAESTAVEKSVTPVSRANLTNVLQPSEEAINDNRPADLVNVEKAAGTTDKGSDEGKKSMCGLVRPIAENVKAIVSKGKVSKATPVEKTKVIEACSMPCQPQPDFLQADSLLSQAYTTTLQHQIYESITMFSTQLVSKIKIINDEINEKVMNDLTTKYERLFGDLKDSFQKDVDDMCGFVQDVKGLLGLSEQELVDYIKHKKLGDTCTRKET